MQEAVTEYLAQGYEEISTDSGTGSRILLHSGLRRAVKIQQDPGYDRFVQFALSVQDPHLPLIHSHKKNEGEFLATSNVMYTVTELELLEPVSEAEGVSWESWIDGVYGTLRGGGTLADVADDPFHLKATFGALRTEAVRVGTNLDSRKRTNLMIRRDERSRTFVLIDPFNA